MKVSLNTDKVDFKGYMPVKNDKGYKNYEFSYPFDPDKYNCYLELFSLNQDKNGNFKINNIVRDRNGNTRLPLKTGSNRINLARNYGITDNVDFAYHFILQDKNSGYVKPAIDAGDSIDDRPHPHHESDSRVYNIVTANQSETTRGGAMRLVITDSQHVGRVYDKNNQVTYDRAIAQKAENAIKTLVNKFGGTMAGVEYGIVNGDYKTDIISLPFTDQTNVYWTKNLFQTDLSLGNINNYASMQREMFKRNMNYVSDGAFVNEGLEGIHFNHVLKWGEDSPYFRWFKASGLKDKPFSLGIFSRDTKHISHKTVNLPYIYEQNSEGKITWKINSDYDDKKPSYIQFFNTKFVTDEERKDNKNLIKSYTKLNSDDFYDINTYNQSITPYHFEINPKDYHKNILRLIEYNNNNPKKEILSIDSYKGTRILSQAPNYTVDEGFESGFETWDANPDIAKLNFGFSNADNKLLMNLPPEERKYEIDKLLRANAQVQDYTVEAGKYWTRKTNDILRLYIAQNISDAASIDKNNASLAARKLREKAQTGILPQILIAKIEDKEVRNVLAGLYSVNNRKLSTENKKSQILEGLMNMPLDSVEFGDNLAAVLASPLISKRASNPKEIGVSRYNLYKAGNPNLADEYKLTYNKMQDLYKNEMLNYAVSVLDKVNDKLPRDNKLFDGENVTKFGQYALPLIVPVIAKYELIKALVPDTKVKINNETGEISYDYNKLKELSLQSIGITNAGSPEDEALTVIRTIKEGLNNLTSDKEIVESLTKTLKGTNANSFALADYIIDKSQAGLDWRIDAAKDIGDIEALKNFNTDFETTWQYVIDFWKRFAQGILSENPHAYMVAEITDMDKIHQKGNGKYSQKFPKTADIVPKFLRETGITSTADYSYLYYKIARMFSRSFEDGAPLSNNPNELTEHLYKIMMKDSTPFLKATSLPSIMYSYTFVANHDKPRPLHGAALDMGLFYADLQNPANKKWRKEAFMVVNDRFIGDISDYDLNNFNFEKVSPKAVAMGLAIHKSCIDTLKEYKDKGYISQEEFDNAFTAICKSVSELANGKFMGKQFEPDSFGVKPIDFNVDMVIKQAKTKYHMQLPGHVMKDFSNDAFRKIVDPAIPKLLAMMKYLVALPGRPTLFDGDDLGSTGYDSETKNMYLQCRNRVHEEWVNPKSSKYKEFIANHKKNFDEVMNMRLRPELEPLNNGAPYMLPQQSALNQENNNTGYNIPAILRQSTNGKITISLLNTCDKSRGLSGDYIYDNEVAYEPEPLVLDSIKLNFESQNGNDVIMNGEYGIGVAGLKNNSVFRNAANSEDKYYVNEHNGKYYLKHGSGDGRIYLNDTTMILYYDPKDPENIKNNPAFTGQYHTQTPKYAISAYTNEKAVCGKKLLLNAQ